MLSHSLGDRKVLAERETACEIGSRGVVWRMEIVQHADSISNRC